MTQNGNIIECRDVSLGYGQDTVLDNVELDIARGVLLPLVGGNGAGKSTFFKALLGLIPLKGGRINRSFGEKRPGYVPQQQHIDPIFPVTVRKIVEMGLYPECRFPYWLSKEMKARLDKTLEQFGLAGHQEKTFGELSGGLRQKTLIARAVIGNSEIIFLDEPVAGLDAGAEEATLNMLINLNHNDGKTILIAHHRLEDLSRLSKNVCMFNHGHVEIKPSDVAFDELRGGAK